MSLRKIFLASCLMGFVFGSLVGCEKPGTTDAPKAKNAAPLVTSGKSATKKAPASTAPKAPAAASDAKAPAATAAPAASTAK
jgi:hypothetical protein